MGANSGGGYNLESSLRFRSSASAYLSRTNINSPTNAKIGTLSMWVKRGSLATGNSQYLIETGTGTSNNTHFTLFFQTDNSLAAGQYSQTPFTNLAALFRDPSAWYHIVITYNSTEATASNRFKLYVNNQLFTSSTTISLNNEWAILQASQLINIGRHTSVGRHLDGYITEFNLVDGQALTPSDFGEYDGTTGVWKPKEYTGTYGTNGFYLPMKETQQATGFNTVLYTGNGGTQSISNVGFSPDLVWIKERNSTSTHSVSDTVRGAGKFLQPDSTAIEVDSASLYVTSFDADGFSLGSAANVNQSGINHVAWCWDAGSSTVSNTDGTITSSVRANPATGFSIVTYTGTGANATIGHGLGTAPSMVITKRRDSTTNNYGMVYHASRGATKALYLSLTNAEDTASNYWNDTAPTTDVFSVGSYTGSNASSGTYVAYCFSEVAGYSKFGSYTGNGSASGPTVTTGFRPAFVMIKRTDVADQWAIADNTRNPSNPANLVLFANLSQAEATSNVVNFNDNGFQIAGTPSWSNTSSGNYIYMAFADTRDAQFNFDASGNKNNWTANNINSNASSETTYDIMNDVPTLTDEDTANYCTLNPLRYGIYPGAAAVTLSEANLKAAWSGDPGTLISTINIPTTGKWYWEAVVPTQTYNFFAVGVVKNQETTNLNNFAGTAGYAAYMHNGLKYILGTGSTYMASTAKNTVITVAFDADTGTLYIGAGGSWANGSGSTNQSFSSAASIVTGLTGDISPAFSFNTGNFIVNFGQRPFAYTPPTGYKKLNTYNLPDSTIKDGSQYMNPVTYTGDGASSHPITGVGFSPDLVWLKQRDGARDNTLFDTVRGATKQISSNQTGAESTQATMLTSFDSDGFTVGSDNPANISGGSFISWNWRGSDSSPVSNTDGTITSSVSANTDSGFSIVTYTANGIQTVGHGLGVAPKMIIVKSRTTSTGWLVGHESVGFSKFMFLNTTAAAVTNATVWNNTAPTSSVFTLGSGVTTAAYGNMVAYCFADVEGFSKFGSYTGNASSNGPFVYTGFRPAFILEKNASSAFGWLLWDTARDTYNVVNDYLVANSSDAEGNQNTIDIVSNGFKLRDPNAGWNQNGSTHIYMAFAENPFKHSLAR